jgi:hypothetical protein
MSTIATSAQGYKYGPPILISIFFQAILVLFIANLLPRVILGPIQVLQVFTAVFISIPSVILAFSNWSAIELKYRMIALLYVLLHQVIIAFFRGESSLLSAVHRKIHLPLVGVACVLIAITLVCFVIVLNSGAININFVNFGELYAKRSELMIVLKSSDLRYLGYALGWAGGILIPIIFYFAIKLRSWIIVVLSLFLFLGSYLMTAQKWILASFFLIIFLHLISALKSPKLINSSDVIRSFNYLVVTLVSLQAVFSKLPFVDMGIRRTLLDPSIMLQYYVKFSYLDSLRWWSDTNIGRYLSNSDSVPASNAIGERYFNQPEIHIYPVRASANAASSSLADSIAQGGPLGMIFYSLVIIAFFYLLHILSVGRDLSIVFVLSGLVATMLFEGTLHTLLLSRGLIVVVLVFLLLPRVFMVSKRV